MKSFYDQRRQKKEQQQQSLAERALMNHSDEELIAQSRTASSGAARNALLDTLFARHHRRVALWCLRWTDDRDQAEDLAQEIFLKVHRSLESFEGQSKFTTWLYTISRNHCINAASAAGRSPASVELDGWLRQTLTSPSPDPQQQLEAQSRWSVARSLVNSTLEETERRVFLLHYVEGWSLPAVTRGLKLTNTSGAKAYLISAQRKIKVAVTRWKARGGSAWPPS